MKKTICSFPFIKRSILPSGLIRPCCDFREDFGTTANFNQKKVEEVKKALKEGVRHPGCLRCWQTEDAGYKSIRDVYSPPNYEEEIVFLDINLSNLCNLTCRMCNSDSSSAWIDIEKELLSDEKTKTFRYKSIHRIQRAFDSDIALISYLDSFNFKHTTRIAIIGGEPFLQPQIELVLLHLLDKNLRNIRIHLITNLTVVNQKIVDLLAQFREVTIQLSIEGTGALYQYIRGGKKYSIKHIESELLRLSKYQSFNFSMSCAIGAYSIFGLAELYLWLMKNIPNAPENVFIKKHWYPIIDPPYLKVDVLPLELRYQALEYNTKILNDAGIKCSSLLLGLPKILQLHSDHNTIQLSNFIAYTKKLDEMRGGIDS